MAVDPLQALQGLQILTGIYFVIAFGITIYQIFLNRRQAKVNDQMKILLNEVSAIRVLLEKKFKVR